MGVKIRGIYSTALTKLLLDKKFDIASPSEAISKRFDMDETEKAHTLIYDKEDLDGIIIHGKKSQEIIKILKSGVGEFMNKKVKTGDIYRGIIENVDMDRKEIMIDIGKEKQGILSLKDYWGFTKEGQPILVQIKGENKNHYLLSSQLRFFGENLVLIKDGFTKPSKHIKDKDEMERLMKLSKSEKLKGWGILWKSLAEGKSKKELTTEIDELIKQEKKIKKVFASGEKPELLKEGFCIFFVDFPKTAKEKLDLVRNQVIPTAKGHHRLKSGGFTMLAELADKFVEHGKQKKIQQYLREIFKNNIKEGNFFKIFHKSPGGNNIVMFGKVKQAGEELKIHRKVKKGGKFDGKRFELNKDDYVITTIKNGSNFVKHEYFDNNDNIIGKCFSINTPVEIYPKLARYINLEVDVVESNGKKEIKGIEDLESKDLPKSLKKMAVKTAKMIKKGDMNV